METKICSLCKVRYRKPNNVRGKRWTERKYCSASCQRKASKTKGMKYKMSEKGSKKLAENARENIKRETPEQRKLRMENVIKSRNANNNWTPPALNKKGELRKNVWKGDEATYNAKHRWIQNNWQKSGTCEDCGKKTKPFGKRKYGTEWANLDGEYDRDKRETWKELCIPCHRAYDNLRRSHVN